MTWTVCQVKSQSSCKLAAWADGSSLREILQGDAVLMQGLLPVHAETGDNAYLARAREWMDASSKMASTPLLDLVLGGPGAAYPRAPPGDKG